MDLKSWNVVLSHLSDLSDWPPFFVFLLLPRSIKKKYKVLGVYFLLASSLKTATLFLASQRINTHGFYHALSLAEFTCLAIFYKQILPKWFFVNVSIIVVIAINLVNSLFVQKFDQFNSNAWAMNTLVLIFLGLVYLYILYQNIEDIQLEKAPLFVVNFGFMIYFAGSIFTYLLAIDIFSQEAVGFFHNAWIIRSIADIIKSPIICFGLWLMRDN